MYSSGTYNIPGRIPCSARAYEKLSNDAHEAGDYWNMAYYEGYTNGLVLIEATEDDFEAAKDFPLFFIPYVEQDIDSFDTFMIELEKSCNKDNEYSSYAQKIASRYGAPDIVVHHLPWTISQIPIHVSMNGRSNSMVQEINMGFLAYLLWP